MRHVSQTQGKLMSKKISEMLTRTILAMQKDPSKLAVELKVHIYACPTGRDTSRAHFKLTSPLIQDSMSPTRIEDEFIHRAHDQKFQPAYGNYTFRQSLADGTKCTNEEASDAATMEFLLKNGVTKALFNLSRVFAEALAKWPTDLVTKQALASGYSDIMRRKLERGTDTNPIMVRVIGRELEALAKLQNSLPLFFVSIFGKLPLDQNSTIVLVAFDDANPCSPVVREAYAAYTTEILQNEIEPEIGPKIVERVQLALDTLATRLARQQVKSEGVTTAPAATSGAVTDESTEEVVAPTENGSLSVGATA